MSGRFLAALPPAATRSWFTGFRSLHQHRCRHLSGSAAQFRTVSLSRIPLLSRPLHAQQPRRRACFSSSLAAALAAPLSTSPARPAEAPIHDDMETVDTAARLEALRALMTENQIDIYIIPSEDAHSSEYTAHCDGRRHYISGFSGSAGCAVVTLSKAALATDGRYFNQASKQLDSNWLLLKQGVQDVPTWQEWTATEAAGGKVVGVDPTLLSSGAARKLAEKIKKNAGGALKAISTNLVDTVWDAGRPKRPAEPIVPLAGRYAGRSIEAKLTELRKEFVKSNAAGFVVSMLDEIAWLFNLRGSDIPYNPVFFSYAIVTPDDARLYLNDAQLTAESRSYLADNRVTVKPYSAIFADATQLSKAAADAAAASATATLPKKFLVSNTASWALSLALGGEKAVEETRSPIGDAKAVKNETELEGMRQCHIRDGAALISYFAWLEEQLKNGVQLDEVTASDKLEELRSKQDLFAGLSFATISSTGANAAVIHYQPERGNCSVIDPKAIYLCDSGAQYFDGTTDTTRTLHFGTPSAAEKKAYTLVLKGNIALDVAVFPKGTTGFALDALARQFLWQEGLDYRHGTGHGVGSYLNVHEGPIGIGTRKQYADVALASGNVTSIEPGFYEDGSYGIRIENMVIVKEVSTTHTFGDKPYLGFEHVTMVPYSRNLIDATLLTDQEKAWLNNHHADILLKTASLLEGDKRAIAWLEKETRPFE